MKLGKVKKHRTDHALGTAKKIAGVSAHGKGSMTIKVGKKSSRKRTGSKKAILA